MGGHPFGGVFVMNDGGKLEVRLTELGSAKVKLLLAHIRERLTDKGGAPVTVTELDILNRALDRGLDSMVSNVVANPYEGLPLRGQFGPLRIGDREEVGQIVQVVPE